MKKPPRVIWESSLNPSDAERALPETIEEWLTYQQQLKRGYRLIFLTPRDEIKARQDLQNA
jgi:hypothetical protein